MVRYATTFSEYVEILATNSPHALILGEWVAHEAVGAVSCDEATFYARHAMRLVWTLASAGTFTDIELPPT